MPSPFTWNSHRGRWPNGNGEGLSDIDFGLPQFSRKLFSRRNRKKNQTDKLSSRMQRKDLPPCRPTRSPWTLMTWKGLVTLSVPRVSCRLHPTSRNDLPLLCPPAYLDDMAIHMPQAANVSWDELFATVHKMNEGHPKICPLSIRKHIGHIVYAVFFHRSESWGHFGPHYPYKTPFP